MIGRIGRRAAKLVSIDASPVGKRIGVAKGLFEVPETIDAPNDEISHRFMGAIPV